MYMFRVFSEVLFTCIPHHIGSSVLILGVFQFGHSALNLDPLMSLIDIVHAIHDSEG